MTFWGFLRGSVASPGGPSGALAAPGWRCGALSAFLGLLVLGSLARSRFKGFPIPHCLASRAGIIHFKMTSVERCVVIWQLLQGTPILRCFPGEQLQGLPQTSANLRQTMRRPHRTNEQTSLPCFCPRMSDRRLLILFFVTLMASQLFCL